VIDLFDASFEKVSVIFSECLVTDFEVLFHRFYIAFRFMFRQLLFSAIDADNFFEDDVATLLECFVYVVC
jgi:hypothetical protein